MTANQHSEHEHNQLYTEVEIEVATVLATIQLQNPSISHYLDLNSPIIHKLCGMMYSLGIRNGLAKAQKVLDEAHQS